MDAAVVELDPLPDPVRPAAEDDDLLLGPYRLRLVVARLVGGVEVGRVRLELGAAGVDGLVDGLDAGGLALGAHRVLRRADERGQAQGGAAPRPERAEPRARERPARR